MQFLVTVLFLLWFHHVAALRACRRARYVTGVAHFAAALAGASAGIIGLYGVPAVQTLGAPWPGIANPAVCLLGVLGAATLVLVPLKLAGYGAAGGDRSRLGWRQGLVLWALLGGLYVCACLADHLAFFATRRVGVADLRALGVSDRRCDGPALVRLEPGHAARYRCPRSIVWGGASSAPLLPWPSYAEGQSRLLDAVLGPLRANAGAAQR